MSKIKNIKEETEEKILTPQEQAAALFKEGNKGDKKDHYNDEEEFYYKIPCSSLIANSIMGGGLPTGAHRFIGNASGGKTSCTLDFMFNFFKEPLKRKGLYIKSEGKLPPEVRERSGVKFTTNPLEWEDGVCLIVESNVYEFVFSVIGDLIRNNPTQTKYFIVIDSMDMLGKRDDLAKAMEDSAQVAGGALLTSVFLKKTSVALAKRGHICIFISQVRATIKIDPRQKTDTNRQANSSGPNSANHAAEWVLEFRARYQDDIIRESADDKYSKPIGHYCNIGIIKSVNETNGQEIRYPIKYGRTGGKSVWVEKELSSLCLMWNFVKKEKISYFWEENLFAELQEKFGETVPEKFVGMTKFEKFFEENEPAAKYLFEKFQNLLK